MPTNKKKLKAKNTFRSYLKSSFVLHVAIAVLAITNIQYFTPEISNQKQVEQATQFETQAYQQAMQDHVIDMQKMKDVLASLLELENTEVITPEDLAIEQEPQTVEELYQASEALLDEIREIKHNVVDELLDELAPLEEETEAKENELSQAAPESNEKANNEPQEKENSQDSGGESEGEGEGDGGSSSPNMGNTMSNEQMLTAIENNTQEAQEIVNQIQQHTNKNETGSNLSQVDSNKNRSGYYTNQEYQNLSQGIDARLFINDKSQAKVEDFTSQMRAIYGEAPSSQQAKSLYDKPHLPARNSYTKARKLTTQGKKSGWIAINTWYIVGPFDNTNRENLHKAFAPERTIDLDAKYLGKNQSVIGWEFLQFDHTPITPPNLDQYEIYYAYTELISDKNQDLWLSIGSDDQSRLWINDILVWNSKMHHKGWMLEEGLRKIRVKKGRNTLLFRLENGQYSGSFSVLMTAPKTH